MREWTVRIIIWHEDPPGMSRDNLWLEALHRAGFARVLEHVREGARVKLIYEIAAPGWTLDSRSWAERVAEQFNWLDLNAVAAPKWVEGVVVK